MAKVSKKELIREVLSRSVEKIYPSTGALARALTQGRKLKIYLGVDPTGPHLHLGHLTNLLVLRRFQKLGHKIIFLIGDFTAKIGDPSGRDTARKLLTEQEIKNNFKNFENQVSRIVKFTSRNSAQLEFNSRWYQKMKPEDFLRLTSHFTAQQIIKRDMFRRRLKKDKLIGLNEFLYPVLQGYDSVAMDVDLEIGGTDQTFNMLRGRDLMRIYKKKEKFVLTTKLLENPKTGRKLMSKSEGGLVNLDDEPNDMFGKVMALPDEAIVPVAEFSSEMPLNKVRGLAKMSPREAKAKTAEAVVAAVWGRGAAKKARERFDKLFLRRETPSNLPVLKITSQRVLAADLVFLSKAVKSKGEARRLIEQGGLKIDAKVIKEPRAVLSLKGGEVLKIGKKRFFQIRR